MKRLKDDRAAYAASQPLFDALRRATIQAKNQKAHLGISRNLVQQLHVKLHNTDDEQNAIRHKQYVDHVVQAWRDATESFMDIFRELAAITGPDPTEGREASHEHEALQEMFESTERASLSGHSYKVGPEMRKSDLLRSAKGPATAPPSSTQRQQIVGRKRSASPTSTQPPRKMQRTAEPAPSPASSLRKPKERVIAAQRANKARRAKRDTSPDWFAPQQQAEPSQNGATEPEPTPRPAGDDMDVQYEDVSAEIEARLKAKAERKKAEEVEKKRKRESWDSVQGEERLRYGMEYINMEDEHRRLGGDGKAPNAKPPKKRLKKKGGGVEVVEEKEDVKRKQDVGEAIDGKQERKKRRKKSA